MRTHVEGALGAQSIERENHVPLDDMHLTQVSDMKRLILSCLNKLTTKGLHRLAMIVTGGSIESVITRGNLKMIIKGSLSSVLSSKSDNHHQRETRGQLFQLLSDPQHFRDRSGPLPELRYQFYHASVSKVLDELPSLPTQTLNAMRMKLKGKKAPIPQLQPCKHGWDRDHLMKLVNNMSRKMLSQHDRGNELQEPLAKAMAVADLSLQVTNGDRSIFSEEFYQFSPEVKSLQSDIMNAIWSVKKVVTVLQLRDLQCRIEPKAVISNRSLRTAFVNFLTEFLYECSDMDSIPKSLSQILDVINKGSDSNMENASLHKHIEEEVDCILSVGAQTKQIVLDLLPEGEFDQDFTDAYVEQQEESDDNSDDEHDDENRLHEDRQSLNGAFSIMDSNYEAESIGDSAPFETHPSTPMTVENVSSCPLATCEKLNSDSENLQPKNFGAENLESMPSKYNACKNQYLAIQDACDKTSMLAYNIAGHMLEEFAITEGRDLNSSSTLYLSGDNQIEDREGIGSFCYFNLF